MPPSYFPLRWEGTGDQWWYASPIDWAAANGHYDVVRELLHIDPNLLIKLTSLHRIRRLEMVWDDDAQFADVAKCRSLVARNLLHECELKKRKNSLICAGYGGWLLYTAASAGDMGFIRELIEKDPLLVFGEGEYGVTDIFYAAARSKNSEAFRLLFDYAISPRCPSGSGAQSEVKKIGVSSVYKSEMMNRAIHAAARGGNLEILKELLKGCSDILAYRDVQGSTVLHSASSKGRVEVVKDLVGSFDIITSVDNQGNTALHIAAYRGHLTVVEVLIHALPSSMSLKNYVGDTFLHMVVSGFRTPGFRRVDRQIELMKQLVGGEVVNLQDVINVRNNDGRTALHTAVIGNIHSNFVELLMSVPSIDLNIRDANNMTPLDLLRQHPQSASSEILMKQLISAGGISNSQDCLARSAIASHLKKRGTGISPGTLFRISDAKIFLHTGIENVSNASGERGSGRQSSCSSACKSELNHIESGNESHGFSRNKKPSSVSYAASRLKMLLGWPRRKDEKINCNSVDSCKVSGLNNSTGSQDKSNGQEHNPTPLRLRFSKTSTLPNNKRILAVRTSDPSPSSKKKFAAGLKHGVLQAMPDLAHPPNSPSTSRPRSPLFAPTPVDKKKGVVVLDNEACGPSCSKLFGNERSPSSSPKSSSADIQLMNQYFCVGAQGLAADNPISGQPSNQAYRPSVLPVA